MNSHTECEQFESNEEDPLSVTKIKIEAQEVKIEAKAETEECNVLPEHIDIKYEICLSPHLVTSEEEDTMETTRGLLQGGDLKLQNSKSYIEEDEINSVPTVHGHCVTHELDLQQRIPSLQEYNNIGEKSFDTSIPMDSHVEFEQVDIKQEENLLSNPESQDIKCDLKTETKESFKFSEHFDIKHEIEPSSQSLVSNKTISEKTNQNHYH